MSRMALYDPSAAVVPVVDPWAPTIWGTPSPTLTKAELELYPAVQRTRSTLRDFSPILAADIIEGINDYHVYVDLPGVHMDDLDITIKDGRLNISAERRQVHNIDNAFYRKTERSFGKVQRSVVIPLGAVESTADAKFANGVLTVRFQKRADYLAGRKLLVT